MEADPDNQVVFVAGALRSGTTLLRIMLDQHLYFVHPIEVNLCLGTRQANYLQRTLSQFY